MNESEIPKRDFDKLLEFFGNVIRSYMKKMTPPREHYLERIKMIDAIIINLENIRNDSVEEFRKQQSACPRILPIHKGYTVDWKLKQFRKAIPNRKIEFISFNSKKGETLLKSIRKLSN